MSEKVKYVCEHCGSEDIEITVLAVWDKLQQTFVVRDGDARLMNDPHCCRCMDDTLLSEVPLDVGDLAREAINKATTTR